MTELEAVRDTYLALHGCYLVTSELVTKSTKGTTFHGTIFVGQPPEEAKRRLALAKAELDGWAIVALVSVFERILFGDRKSSPRDKSGPAVAQGLHHAIKRFRQSVSARVYEDIERLCRYRDWVAHGKRWEKPTVADPISSYVRLVDCLSQAGLSAKKRSPDWAKP